MRRIIASLAVLSVLPSLAFASGECAHYTDEQYRAALISHPFVESFSENGISATITSNYHKSGSFDAQTILYTSIGTGVIDMKGLWNVKNAVLSIHLSKVTHRRANNGQLNNALDTVVAKLLETTDYTVQLDNCKRALPSASFLLKL